jgi:hypothetical protein
MEGEYIISVLFSVWGGEHGMFKRGREGILVLTNKRIAFISKTDMDIDSWKREVDTQVKELYKNKDAIRVPKTYTLDMLNNDARYEKNVVIPLKSIVELSSEKKRWGTLLIIAFKNNNDSIIKYSFSVVRSWIRYPVADPIEHEHVDWDGWIRLARKHMDIA